MKVFPKARYFTCHQSSQPDEDEKGILSALRRAIDRASRALRAKKSEVRERLSQDAEADYREALQLMIQAPPQANGADIVKSLCDLEALLRKLATPSTKRKGDFLPDSYQQPSLSTSRSTVPELKFPQARVLKKPEKANKCSASLASENLAWVINKICGKPHSGGSKVSGGLA